MYQYKCININIFFLDNLECVNFCGSCDQVRGESMVSAPSVLVSLRRFGIVKGDLASSTTAPHVSHALDTGTSRVPRYYYNCI